MLACAPGHANDKERRGEERREGGNRDIGDGDGERAAPKRQPKDIPAVAENLFIAGPLFKKLVSREPCGEAAERRFRDLLRPAARNHVSAAPFESDSSTERSRQPRERQRNVMQRCSNVAQPPLPRENSVSLRVTATQARRSPAVEAPA